MKSRSSVVLCCSVFWAFGLARGYRDHRGNFPPEMRETRGGGDKTSRTKSAFQTREREEAPLNWWKRDVHRKKGVSPHARSGKPSLAPRWSKWSTVIPHDATTTPTYSRKAALALNQVGKRGRMRNGFVDFLQQPPSAGVNYADRNKSDWRSQLVSIYLESTLCLTTSFVFLIHITS